MTDSIEISNDFLLIPENNRVQLTPPEMLNIHKGIAMKELLRLPMNVFFQTPESVILRCNDQVFTTLFAASYDYGTPQDLIGVNLEKMCRRQSLKQIKTDDQKVIQLNQLMIFENEVHLKREDIILSFLSFKFPCYLKKNQNPIVFGVSVLLNNNFSQTAAPLAEALKILLNFGFLNQCSTHYGFSTRFNEKKTDDIHITSQESKCLYWVTRGMTSKKIGIELGISYKTVERHFENLRYKLNVKSKSELIEKFLYHQSNKINL